MKNFEIREISLSNFKTQIEKRTLSVEDVINYLLTLDGFTSNAEDPKSLQDIKYNNINITDAQINNKEYVLYLVAGEYKDEYLGLNFYYGLDECKVIKYLPAYKMYLIQNFTKNKSNELLTKEALKKNLEKQDEFKKRIERNKEFTKKMKIIEEEEKRREEQEKKEYNSDYGFTANKTDLQKGKILKTLNMIIKYDNDFYSRKDLIVKIIKEHDNIELKEVYLKNRYSHKKIEGCYKKLKDKTELRMYFTENGVEYFREITKTEFDFCKYLLNNKHLLEE